MKNIKRETELVTVYFPYEVYDGDELVEDALLAKEFSVDELELLAEIFQKNGGYGVDMCELENLEEELRECIYMDELEKLFPGEEDYSCFDVCLCEETPAELIEAVDHYVKYKDVDQDFYLNVDGKEIKKSFLLRISNDTFLQMKKIVTSGPYDKSDFDMLMEYAPQAYNEVAELVFEWAYKYSIREYGQNKPCVLKNFPFQVYENL